MSLINVCSCALIKDHKMRQIINDLYLLFLRIMNFKKKYFDLFFFQELRLYPSSPLIVYTLGASHLIPRGGPGFFIKKNKL